MISLRNVTRRDLDDIHHFAQAIHSEQFMSRYLPYGDSYEQMASNALVWKIILVENSAAGVIWLDKTETINEVVLGIMLFSPTQFGKGIGQAAIKLVIEELQTIKWAGLIKLNVRIQNERAIACYQRLGFEVTGTGSKNTHGKQISYLRMVNILQS